MSPSSSLSWSSLTSSLTAGVSPYWWSNNGASTSTSPPPTPPDTGSQRPRKKVTPERRQVIEVIGGGGARGGADSFPPSLNRIDDPRSTATIFPSRCGHATVGPPRLPAELSTAIVFLAAQSVFYDDDDGGISGESGEDHPHHQEPITTTTAPDIKHRDDASRTQRLFNLCLVDSHSYRLILSTLLLPSVHLRGAEQVTSFSLALLRDRRDFRSLARTKLRRLVVRLDKTGAAAGKEEEEGKRMALYDAAERQTRFERATLGHLRRILAVCYGVERVVMECMPRVLLPLSRSKGKVDIKEDDDEEEATDEEQRNLDALTSRLSRLSCQLSVYAGPFNDSFWSSPPPTASAGGVGNRWASLTHLQLYGPRMRFTPSTARALSTLPQLSHLALVMPLFVDPPPEGEEGTTVYDANGRASTLQMLLSGCAGRLRTLVVVAHGMREYVGYVERYRPLIEGLQMVPAVSIGGGPASSTTTTTTKTEGEEEDKGGCTVHLVTAWERNLPANGSRVGRGYAHPSFYARWMMDRTERGQEWEWSNPVTVDGGVEYSVKTRRIDPISPVRWEEEEEDGEEEEESGRVDDDSTSSVEPSWRAANSMDDVPTSQNVGEDEVWGIDNLD